MILSYTDRIAIDRGILPGRGNMLEMALTVEIRNKVRLTAGQLEAVGFSPDPESGRYKFSIDRGNQVKNNIPLTVTELGFLKAQVDTPDKKGAVDAAAFQTCERIREAIEPNPEEKEPDQTNAKTPAGVQAEPINP